MLTTPGQEQRLSHYDTFALKMQLMRANLYGIIAYNQLIASENCAMEP
jgi:hypothetical protein